MEQNPLISVIVPVYRVEEYLPKCVDSILTQTYSNLEIILVDDGSPDGSGAICDDYAARDSRVRVIHKRNGGLSSARNAGLDEANGDYIGFVDSDDWLEPDMYAVMLDAALKNDAPLVCAGRFDEWHGQRIDGLCPQRDEVVTGKDLVRRIFRWDHLDSAAWDKLYRRDLFREIRYPVGKIVEDIPTTYRIALLAGKAALVSRRFYHYLHRENSITYTDQITEKTFHFSQHTLRVYEDIRENVPELEPEAKYLRVRSLVYNLKLLELAGAEACERWSEPYWDSRRALREHAVFILTSNLFTRREKLENLLLAAGLYRAFRRVYHLLHRSDPDEV